MKWKQFGESRVPCGRHSGFDRESKRFTAPVNQYAGMPVTEAAYPERIRT